MSGGGGGGDTTTTNEPWSGQEPFLRDLYAQAQHMFGSGQGQQYYPGQQVADFSGATQQGLDMMQQQGMQGSPLQDPMNQFLGQSMYNPAGMAGVGSDMPGQNPYLDQMVGTVGRRMGEQFQDYTAPSIAAQFGGAGRTGGALQGQTMADASGEMMQQFGEQAADIYGTDYQRAMQRDIERRDLMGDIGFRGATLAPQSQSMEMQNIDQMMRAGAITEDQAQRLIDAQMQEFNFYQQAPWQALNQYGNVVNSLPGGYGEATQEGGGGNRMSGMAGGAAAGTAIMPGWGTAIGAGLGYMMS